MKDYKLKINGHEYNVTINAVNDESTEAKVVVNGVNYDVEIVGGTAAAAKKPQVVSAPKALGLSVTPTSAPASAPARSAASAAAGAGFKVTCPLPGTVIALKVKEGDTVSAGQTVAILEAMKMENNIDAGKGGVVKQILAQAGATVMEGDVLMVIE